MTGQADPQELMVDGITAGFDEIVVLHGVSLTLRRGEVAALLGPNGAGKTTLLRVIAGELRPTAGTVRLDGADLAAEAPDRRARRGLCLVPEGRAVFPGLTVRDNLRLQLPPWRRDGKPEEAYEVFPELADHAGRPAGALSGGQQQMLALARCWLARPSFVLLDEVSMGLAPKVVDRIFAALHALARTGVGVLLVEQYAARALELASTAHLLGHGRLVHSGPAAGVDVSALLDEYLGGASAASPDPRADPSRA